LGGKTSRKDSDEKCQENVREGNRGVVLRDLASHEKSLKSNCPHTNTCMGREVWPEHEGWIALTRITGRRM